MRQLSHLLCQRVYFFSADGLNTGAGRHGAFCMYVSMAAADLLPAPARCWQGMLSVPRVRLDRNYFYISHTPQCSEVQLSPHGSEVTRNQQGGTPPLSVVESRSTDDDQARGSSNKGVSLTASPTKYAPPAEDFTRTIVARVPAPKARDLGPGTRTSHGRSGRDPVSRQGGV